jgi:hypothetical protein
MSVVPSVSVGDLCRLLILLLNAVMIRFTAVGVSLTQATPTAGTGTLGGGGGRLRPKLRTSAPLHLSETRSRAHATQ